MEGKYFTEKPFSELTKEDFQRMVRNPKHRLEYEASEILEHYGVDIDEYCKRIREVGLKITSREREIIQEWRKKHPINRSSEKKQRKVAGYELKAMRLLRKKSISDMAKLTGEYADWLRMVERSRNVPPRMVDSYRRVLGIKKGHMEQFDKIIKGKTKEFVEEREIPNVIRKEVKKKYGNKCAHCNTSKYLQIHHKEYFSKGGQHTLDNLILLCADCHAEEHKGETAYGLIKSRGGGQ